VPAHRSPYHRDHKTGPGRTLIISAVVEFLLEFVLTLLRPYAGYPQDHNVQQAIGRISREPIHLRQCEIFGYNCGYCDKGSN
jgi:hypothetical protein